MHKKAFLATLVAVIVLTAVTAINAKVVPTANAQNGIQIKVHGKAVQLPAQPVVVQNITLVPLKPVAQALGAKVKPGRDKQQRQTATLTRGDRTALITVGISTMSVSGKMLKLDVAPRLENGEIMVPLRAISESLGAVVTWDSINRVIRIDNPAELPVIGTEENLRKLVKRINENQTVYGRSGMRVTVTTVESVNSAPMAKSMDGDAAAAFTETSAAGGSGSDHSTTNVQVAGVDEADTAKTDGRFIYQISGGRVLIVDITNETAPTLAANIEYDAKDGFQPLELYVDDHRLTVIGQHALPMPGKPVEPGIGGPSAKEKIAAEAKMMWRPMRSAVKTIVYSLDSDGQPTLTRETEMEGNYVSSRKIGSALYVVTNKFNDIYPWIEPSASGMKAGDAANAFGPVYGDSAAKGGLKLTQLPLTDIRYFPESPETSTMLVGALDLDQPAQPLQVSAYMGSGQTIYASTKNLYVAITQYTPKGDSFKEETQVHKFRLDQGSVVYLGKGSVPGTILNQFSMDEYQGTFRITTTRNQVWNGNDANPSMNNLYVLDESLQTIGTLEDLAPGEHIYSTRFMGKRAYIVTFRTVDPLFAVDLTNPAKPAVLGQLKIPGYSDYLHPYDENHIIGFGKETIELSNPNGGVGSQSTMAYYQGMKIGLFDVTDPTHPVEKFKEVIGDRGTNSELLQNHKALLFSKEKGLMAFPVDLAEINNKNPDANGGFPAYGEFTYQGAYVYGIDLKMGFKLRGRVTHLSDDDLAKSGMRGYDYSKAVHRILYAGNTLYTLSDSMLKANDLTSLDARGALTYPAPPAPVYQIYKVGGQGVPASNPAAPAATK